MEAEIILLLIYVFAGLLIIIYIWYKSIIIGSRYTKIIANAKREIISQKRYFSTQDPIYTDAYQCILEQICAKYSIAKEWSNLAKKDKSGRTSHVQKLEVLSKEAITLVDIMHKLNETCIDERGAKLHNQQINAEEKVRAIMELIKGMDPIDTLKQKYEDSTY